MNDDPEMIDPAGPEELPVNVDVDDPRTIPIPPTMSEAARQKLEDQARQLKEDLDGEEDFPIEKITDRLIDTVQEIIQDEDIQRAAVPAVNRVVNVPYVPERLEGLALRQAYDGVQLGLGQLLESLKQGQASVDTVG